MPDPTDNTDLDSSFASPNELAMRRAYAKGLIQQGMGPITPSSGGAVSGWQGIAGVLQALSGNYLMNQANQQERASNMARGAGYEAETTGGPLSTSPPSGSASSSDPMQNYAAATSTQESGGDYGALGKVIINPSTKQPDRAYGKYGVMGANIPQWTQEVLGQPLTPEQFLANPKAQDAVYQTKFGQLAQKYGPVGASKAWFAGEGGMNNPNAADANGMTVARYGQNFAKLASAGGGLPQGTALPGGPENAPAAPSGAGGGPLAAMPPQGGAVLPGGGTGTNSASQPDQEVKVAAGPQGLPPVIPPSPSMGAPGQAPANSSGNVSPGFFSQRPHISPKQYKAFMSNPAVSPEERAAMRATWLGQNQPTTFKSQFGTIVRGADGQQQFIGDPVDMSIKSPAGDVPVHGIYNSDGSIRILQPASQGNQPPASAPTPAPNAPGPSGAVEGAMPKFASLEGGTTNDAGMLGANPPAKEGVLPQTPVGMPTGGAVASLNSVAPSANGPLIATSPSQPQGTQVAQSMLPQYARDTMSDLGGIAAQNEAKTEYAKGDVENYNKDYAQFQQMGINAINNGQQVALAQHLIHDPHITQGPGTPIKLAWEQLKAFGGSKAAQTNLAYNTAFDKIVAGGILRDMKTLLGGWAGQVRNAEIALLDKASASSHNTIGANQAILDLSQKSQQQMVDIGKLTNLYRQGYAFDNSGNPVTDQNGNYKMVGGTPTSAGQNAIVRSYLINHPLLTPQEIDHYDSVLGEAEKGGGGVAHGPLSVNPPVSVPSGMTPQSAAAAAAAEKARRQAVPAQP